MAATATIISNGAVIRWDGTSQTNITEDKDTTVTNSSTGSVYWGVGATTNLLKKNASKTFKRKTDTFVYQFSSSAGGGGEITLTLLGSGGGGGGSGSDSPVPAAEGESEGEGKGKGKGEGKGKGKGHEGQDGCDD